MRQLPPQHLKYLARTNQPPKSVQVPGIQHSQTPPPLPPQVPRPKNLEPVKLHLTNFLSPGDCLVMTASLKCLWEQYPGQYRVQVTSSCNAVYENSDVIDKSFSLSDPDVTTINMEYPLIHQSGSRPVHFIQGYVDFLGATLRIPLQCSTNHPQLYLSPGERRGVSPIHALLGKPTQYWVINAGVKSDYTCKGWGHQNYQEVVNALRGKVQFVQIGEQPKSGDVQHLHKPLDGVINLIGRTTPRELIVLCWHAAGGVGPITFLQHIFAAYEKPYVALLGGRETVTWEHYPTQTTMSTIGQLPCCQYNGCWRSRVVPLKDGDHKNKSLCELPVLQENGEYLPKCMTMIRSDDVVKQILRYYDGGVLHQAITGFPAQHA